jgi:RNA polymerase sigma-70 factor (ECF subfamily)
MARWSCFRTKTDRCGIGGVIADGHALVAASIRRNQPGPYQLQAAVNAVHTDAATAAETDWGQILQLYDHLYWLSPTPIVALNRAAAVAEVHGAMVGLAELDALNLSGYHLVHGARADLLRRLDRHREAADEYDLVRSLATNSAERRFLANRRQALPRPWPRTRRVRVAPWRTTATAPAHRVVVASPTRTRGNAPRCQSRDRRPS